MAKINISIPDATKSAMDALDDVNWSEVARAAFDRIIQQKKSMRVGNMEAVIERLKRSKAEAADADESTGKRDGSQWAQKYASYRDLKRIGALELDEGGVSFASQVDIALGNPGNDWGQSFWNDGDEFMSVPNNDYVSGWVEGAQSVWDEVAGKL
jgi:hypothetical protein